MIAREDIEAMEKNNCVKEKCRFYYALSECAIDGCMYGASEEDKEKERGCYMNGFQMLADSYRKAAIEGKVEQEYADKECKVLDFLATCDDDDFYHLFDSSAFNEIMMSYVRRAVNNVSDLTDEQRIAVRNEVNMLLSECTAKEICEG